MQDTYDADRDEELMAELYFHVAAFGQGRPFGHEFGFTSDLVQVRVGANLFVLCKIWDISEEIKQGSWISSADMNAGFAIVTGALLSVKPDSGDLVIEGFRNYVGAYSTYEAARDAHVSNLEMRVSMHKTQFKQAKRDLRTARHIKLIDPV